MKNYSYVGISLVILVFGIIFIPEIIDRVSDKEVVTSNRSDNENNKKRVSDATLPYILIDGEKKKIPAFEFVNQEGDTISNRDFEGKVFIAEFFFTTCPTICPIMNQNLVMVQKEFQGEDAFGIASFTIDPEHDSPEVLKKYAEANGIEHPNWHLLTGERAEIYDLANTGFNIYAGVNPEAEGGFEHSGHFALIDKEGYIRSRTDQFGNPIIYYRGSIERGKKAAFGEEEPQIDILIEDAKKLL